MKIIFQENIKINKNYNKMFVKLFFYFYKNIHEYPWISSNIEKV